MRTHTTILILCATLILAGCSGYGTFARSPEGEQAREQGAAIGRAVAPLVAPLAGPASGVAEEAIPYLAGLASVLLGYTIRHWLSPNRAVLAAIATDTRRGSA